MMMESRSVVPRALGWRMCVCVYKVRARNGLVCNGTVMYPNFVGDYMDPYMCYNS